MRNPEPLSVVPARFEDMLQRVTADALDAAAHTDCGRRLAEGRLSREGYVRLLAGLQSLYAELEWALEWNRRHPLVRSFCQPELWRNELLQDDLRALLGTSWHDLASRWGAAPHVERLGVLCDAAPELLLAHVWVLYVAELPGFSGATVDHLVPSWLRGMGGSSFLHHAVSLDGAVARVRMLESFERRVVGAVSRAALLGEARMAADWMREFYASIEDSASTPLALGHRVFLG